MPQQYPSLTDELREWIAQQPLFFVGSAPLAGDGRVNISPKGLDTLRVLAPDCVAYLDLSGGSSQTAAHLLENGRITFMFCAFSGAPRILRLYGRGRVVRPQDAQWDALAAHFPRLPDARHIIVSEIELVQLSCGLAVPLLEYIGPRDSGTKWAARAGEAEPAAHLAAPDDHHRGDLPTALAAPQ